MKSLVEIKYGATLHVIVCWKTQSTSSCKEKNIFLPRGTDSISLNFREAKAQFQNSGSDFHTFSKHFKCTSDMKSHGSMRTHINSHNIQSHPFINTSCASHREHADQPIDKNRRPPASSQDHSISCITITHSLAKTKQPIKQPNQTPQPNHHPSSRFYYVKTQSTSPYHCLLRSKAPNTPPPPPGVIGWMREPLLLFEGV